jgi:hypothetical protein
VLNRAAAAFAVLSLVLLGAQIAGAGDVTQKDRTGDVSAKGLTKAERDAIDIVSMRVIGQEGLGVFVTATFKGNFAQLFGRGHLKNAVAVLVLHPKPGKGDPAGVVTEGAGKGERDLRVSRSEVVATVRQGRELTFLLAGGGFLNLATVEVKVVTETTSSTARTITQNAPPTLDAKRWKKLLKAAGRDAAAATALAADLSCDDLKSLRAAIDRKIEVVKRIGLSPTRLANFMSFRDAVDALIAQRCGQSGLGANFTWRTFSTREVAGSGSFTGPAGNVTAVRVTVPDAGSTDRRITNFLCPSQLPQPLVSGDTITCSGGTLAVGQSFTLNLQTSPDPTTGMGGQLFGELNGSFSGPFPIGGP